MSFVRLAGGLEGICNGIDTQEWSPFCDKYLDVKYDSSSMEEGKAIAKETLQAELGLEVGLTRMPHLNAFLPSFCRCSAETQPFTFS